MENIYHYSSEISQTLLKAFAYLKNNEKSNYTEFINLTKWLNIYSPFLQFLFSEERKFILCENIRNFLQVKTINENCISNSKQFNIMLGKIFFYLEDLNQSYIILEKELNNNISSENNNIFLEILYLSNIQILLFMKYKQGIIQKENFEEIIKISERKLKEENNSSLVLSQEFKSYIYNIWGKFSSIFYKNFEQGKYFFLRANEINLEIFDFYQIGYNLNWIAYIELKQKANSKEVIKIYKEINENFSKMHPHYSNFIDNLNVKYHNLKLKEIQAMEKISIAKIRLKIICGFDFFNEKKYNIALKFFEEVLSLINNLEINKKNEILLDVYNLLGFCYSKINNYNKAEENYELAKQIAEEIAVSREVYIKDNLIYTNAVFYFLQILTKICSYSSNYLNAVKFAIEGVNIYESKLKGFNSEEFIEKFNILKANLSSNYLKIGNYYLSENTMKSLIDSFEDENKKNNEFFYFICKIKYFEILTINSKIQKMQPFLNEVLKILKEIGFNLKAKSTLFYNKIKDFQFFGLLFKSAGWFCIFYYLFYY